MVQMGLSGKLPVHNGMKAKGNTPIVTRKDVQAIKAVAFDLDGTLYPEYRMLFPTLSVALRHPKLLYYFSRVRKEIRLKSDNTNFRRTQAELLAKYLKTTTATGVTMTYDAINFRTVRRCGYKVVFPSLFFQREGLF